MDGCCRPRRGSGPGAALDASLSERAQLIHWHAETPLCTSMLMRMSMPMLIPHLNPYSPRPHALTLSRPHALTPPRSHALTPQRSHALTLSRPHALTLSRPHALTLLRPHAPTLTRHVRRVTVPPPSPLSQ
eukprot:3395200-Pleurochrysis_carterae.AAC.1